MGSDLSVFEPNLFYLGIDVEDLLLVDQMLVLNGDSFIGLSTRDAALQLGVTSVTISTGGTAVLSGAGDLLASASFRGNRCSVVIGGHAVLDRVPSYIPPPLTV